MVQTADELLANGSEAFHASLATALEAAMQKPMPQMELRFTDLSINADVVLATKDGHELPTLVNHAKKIVLGLFRTKRSVKKEVLHPMTGVLKPSTTTLLLGQPGSGKSSFMKFLSGRFPMHKNISVGGHVSYNGKDMTLVKQLLPQFTAYVNQRDFHYPTLSVKETIAFAHASCGGAIVPPRVLNTLKNGTPEQNQHAKDIIESLYKVYPDIITRQMGLVHCEETIVGDGMLRGVSGGERKRVTVGEMEFGMKQVSFMDEISTGLDSAATYDIVKCQKSMASSLRKTIVIALLQPSPEVYNLFDDILLLNEGHVMYHGPREHCLEYFEALGFKCPPKRDVADFLLDIGTPQQDQYIVDGATPPVTPAEYASMFRESAIYKAMLAHISGSFDLALIDDANKFMLEMPPQRMSFVQSTKLLIARQLTVFLRNKAFVKSRIVMVLLMGLLYSSMFYHVNPQNPVVILGVIFMAVLFLAMGQVPMMPAHLEARNIYYKQSSASFFRTSSFILAQSFTQVPFAIVETLVFGSIMYWITGFVSEAGAFLTYLLMLFLTNLSFASWFFFISMVSPDLHVAKPLSMLTVLIFILFAGFIISPTLIPDYFIWIYWINPLSWCIRSLTINQYSSSEFQQNVYEGINYMKIKGDTMGNAMLKIFGFQTGKEWIWYGAIYLAASYFVYLSFAYVALEYVRYDAPENVVVHPDEIETKGGKSPPKTPPKNAVVVNVHDPTATSIPVTLAFKDLWYTVPNPKKGEPDLKLLKGVNGYAVPGTITALMGSSGAGKTTLMDVIAGRKTGGKIEGQILLNGYPATDLAIRRATGYCEQMDIHCESATFREALQFSAMLRQSHTISKQSKLAFAEQCLNVLGMVNLGDNIIRGSSVEQMKRLTIGVELAAAPSILFLDEPTSGLDARSAKIIMSGIRKIASTGRTVVCTIHQPSTEVFQMFDNLLLLKRGGETVFFGPLGENSKHLINYFEGIPNTLPLQPGANPATWMLECIGAGVEARHTDGEAVDYVKAFKESSLNAALVKELEIHGSPNPSMQELKYATKRAATSFTQFIYLTQRFFRMYWRTPTYNFTRAMMALILAVLFGLVYRGVNYGTYVGATGGVGMIFLTSLFIGMISFNSVLPLASEERASFYRERASQTYAAVWYWVGSTLAEIPYVFITTFMFTIIFYPFVGFRESVGACAFYGVNLSFMVLMNVYFGQLLSYAMPRVDIAALMGVLLNSIFFLFMGFNPPGSEIPSGYQWLYTITPPRFSLALLVAETFANCYDGTQLGCQIMPASGIPLSLTQQLNTTQITVKEYVEFMYKMKFDDRWLNFFVVLGIIVLWRLLALLSLIFINHQKR